jgi:hypothetical protein
LPKNPKSDSSKEKSIDVSALRKALLSIGVDKPSAEKLLGSRALNKIVVPVYWKDGLEFHVNSLWIPKLPSFLRSFEKVFPDGQVRWDPDYDEENPQDQTSDVAIRVYFNYQEDDQGNHWSPKPTLIEDKSYRRMLKQFSYKGQSPAQAHGVLHGN